MKFWMVYIMGGCQPRVRHNTYNSAYQELLRLTKLTKTSGYILETVATSHYTPPTPPEGTATVTRF